MSDTATHIVEDRVDEHVDERQLEAAPPQLGPPPQFDLSLSMDSILNAGTKDTIEGPEKLLKLSEEKRKLDERLKELRDKLAAVERRTEELEAKQGH